jgi:hypothetical protein
VRYVGCNVISQRSEVTASDPKRCYANIHWIALGKPHFHPNAVNWINHQDAAFKRHVIRVSEQAVAGSPTRALLVISGMWWTNSFRNSFYSSKHSIAFHIVDLLVSTDSIFNGRRCRGLFPTLPELGFHNWGSREIFFLPLVSAGINAKIYGRFLRGHPQFFIHDY